MMVFSMAILVTNFPKMDENLIFLLNFHQNVSRFPPNFPTPCVFHPNARKFNTWIVKYFEKYAKIMDCSKFSKYIF